MNNNEYVNFGDVVARGKLGMPCQYISRYLHGKIEGWPNLAKGLRIKGDPVNMFHFVTMHKDDVDEFAKRYREYIERAVASGKSERSDISAANLRIENMIKEAVEHFQNLRTAAAWDIIYDIEQLIFDGDIDLLSENRDKLDDLRKKLEHDDDACFGDL